MTYLEGEHFTLWQDNKKLGSISFDHKGDDRTSKHHKVFLQKGKANIQVSVIRNDFDKWGLAWLEFTKAD